MTFRSLGWSLVALAAATSAAFAQPSPEPWSEIVLSRGRIMVDNGKLVTEGGGQFIKRARCGELLR